MTRHEFEKEYGLSRRQTDRLFDKARADGFFEIPGCGRFNIRKGKGRTDPIEVFTVSQSVSAPVREDRENLPKAELDRLLVLANIRKTEQQIAEEREKIRAEAFAEIEGIRVRQFAKLRNVLEDPLFPSEWREKIREALNGCD